MIPSGNRVVVMKGRRGQEEDLNLPPGFRFNPTDQELMLHYLCKKVASLPIQMPIIQELDLYKLNPWELPDMALFGEKEWYFFTPRDRKYPNGHRPNRAAGSGYWKATGVDKPIFKTSDGFQKVGVKKSLVFFKGKLPKGVKTNWIMHEYRLPESATTSRNNNNNDDDRNSRLEGWVLCRIYCKKASTAGKIGKQIETTNTTIMKGIEEDSSFCSLDGDEDSQVNNSTNEEITLCSSLDVSEFPWDDNLLAILSPPYSVPPLTTTLDFNGSPSVWASVRGSNGNM